MFFCNSNNSFAKGDSPIIKLVVIILIYYINVVLRIKGIMKVRQLGDTIMKRKSLLLALRYIRAYYSINLQMPYKWSPCIWLMKIIFNA